MEMTILFNGNPLTLAGEALEVGVEAPDFTVVDTELKDVRLADFKDAVKVVTSFPSLDTPVCDLQLNEFNRRAASLGEGVVVLGISKDLPFAQKRFCAAHGIENVRVLSDYRLSSFGKNYGLLIKELNLLARAVLILDRDNILRYSQVVGELTDQPDYEAAMESLGTLL